MKYFYSFLLGCLAFSYSNGQSCTELFFSEYIEGSSNNKAIEVYNPSTNTVNLSNYEIHRFNNGSTSSSGTFTLNGTLDSGEVYVIANPSANSSIMSKSDTTSTITYYNGDDVLLLIKGTDTLDAIGELGVDPGTNWTVGTGATSEYTLVRKSNVDQGTTDWTTGATQWDVYPQNNDADLGMHTSNCIASGPATTIPFYTISQITTNDANGVADSLNVECAIEGVVYTIDFDGNNGISFYIEDATDGINVFNFNDVDSYVVTAGDKLYIEGSVGQYNGLTEMIPDSIYVVSSGNPLPTPSVVTSITESNEGRYIQLNNVSLVDTSQWPSLNQWANVDVTNGTDTLAIYIDSDSDIDGSPVPTGMFNIKGAGSQFDFSSPYTSGYQLIPSSVNDITTAVVSTPCSDLMFSEYIEGGSNNKAIEIYNPTNASINLTGYSVAMFSNGGTSPTATYSLPGSLASGDVYVICADQANATIVSKADTAMSYPSPAHFNGNDAVILLNSSNDTIDAIGVVGNDPGSNGWTVGTGSTKDYTLVRMASVDAGTKDWSIGATQWDVHPKDTTMFLGSHTSNCVGGPSMPLYAISDITGVDANGEPDSINVYCAISGIVSGWNLRTSGVEFWLIDPNNTDGLLVRNSSSSFNSYTVTEGDMVYVRGTVDEYNGLIQFVPDSVGVMSTGNTLPSPLVTNSLSESTEGRLLEMQFMSYVSGSWPSSGSSGNITVTDGTNNFTMRLNSGTDVADSITSAPTGYFHIRGHGGQFDGSIPKNSGYQIQPRYSTDIIPVAVTSPTISFNSGLQLVSEGDGVVPVHMVIGPTSNNAETVKVYVKDGSGVTSGDYSTVPAAVNDTITLSVPAGEDTVSFNVSIVDDSMLEPNDTIFFSLASVSSGLTVGPIATQDFVISDNDVYIPTYNITDINGLDADGKLDSIGVQCKLIGTVLGVDLQGVASSNVQFTIHDGSVGMGVYSSAMTNYTVTEGDEVRVIGDMGQFNGLSQIYADSIVVISTGNTLPNPKTVTVLDESTESDLVMIKGVTIPDPTQWTNSGSGFNVDITDGTTTWEIRIDNEVDLYNLPAPQGTFDVIGIGGQFDNSSPYSSGYQLLPRYLADIVYPQPPSYSLSISEIMPGSADPNTAVNDDWFEIYNYGQTTVNLQGFSFDDDGETPGDNVFGNVDVQPGEAIVVWRGSDNDEATFRSSWKLPPASVGIQIITRDDLNGNYPSLSQGGDLVVLYDTSAVPVEICKSSYNAAVAGFAVLFDTTCSYLGNAVDGVDGAYTSNGNDVGSPGNFIPIGIHEFEKGSINVYPNPANDVLNIDSKIEGEYQINLINMLGEIVITDMRNSSNERISIEGLTPGVYMLQIIQDAKTATISVVKQ